MDESWGERQRRTLKLLGFVAVCLALLGFQMVRRQLFEGHWLAQQAIAQRAQGFPLEVARGEILDRNRQSLTGTTSRYSAVAFPALIRDKDGTAASVAVLLGLDRGRLLEQLLGSGPPVVVAADISAERVEAVRKAAISGVIGIQEKVRYGQTSLAHHAVGYINNALDNQGKDGLERDFDRYLRGGRPEEVMAFIDANRRPIPGLGLRVQLPDTAGSSATGGPHTLVTTIDARIQRIVEEAMDKYVPRGAAVVVDPRNGDILAMASRPDFDPNDVGAYLNADDSPLLNRTVKGYPPGSVFKVVTAAAALEAGVVRPGDVFDDPGYIDVQGRRYRCYKDGGHGRLTFTEAMAYSCNPVFIEVGQKVGAAKAADLARSLGFGSKLGLPVAQESPGNVPEETAVGDPNLSIGQGALLVTPAQVAQMMTAVANNGVVAGLRLIKEIDDSMGVAVERGPEVRLSQAFSWLTATRLRSMLRDVVAYGTGTPAAPEGITAAGKTGSAETGKVGAGGESISHGWFAGYAPASSPRLVVVVFAEEGMTGGKAAGPVFKEIVERALARVGGR
ncbi:MAG: peptidoglycan D,D-transpeptidase FtsI family protein [Bacillota bacterium]